MHRGYIKLWRRMFDKGWFNNPDILALWVHLLFKANHKDTEVFIGLNKIPIKRGQFITSRQHLSVESGIEQSKIERILNMLKTEHQIEQQSFNKFRMITITNWDKYQISEQQNEQQMNNKRTANEQQMNTDNNDNNVKNDKNKILLPPTAKRKCIIPDDFILSDKMKEYAHQKGIVNGKCEELFEAFFDWHKAKGDLMADWVAAWRTWVRNDIKYRENKTDPDSKLLKLMGA